MKFKLISHLFVCATVALAVVGCNEAPVAPPTAEYEMLTLTSSDCQIDKLASATIRGRQDIDIIPQVSGRITKILVTEGQSVKRGQVMFIIDQVPYRAAVATAEANVATAKATLATSALTLESKEELFKAKVVSEYDLTTARNAKLVAEANLAQAEAALINANNNLTYTTVTSPADGVIGGLPYYEGALVSSAIVEPLTTVSDNSTMWVYFSIPENELLTMIRKSGSREKAIEEFPAISLQLSDGSMYEIEGEIESLTGVINRSTGTISARATFANPNGLLHSGATGNIIIKTSREDVLLIPQSTTFEIQNKVFVYKIVDGVAKAFIIEVTPVTGGKEFIVESGLVAGDKIISEGVGTLRPGTPILEKGAAPVAMPTATATEDKE